MDERAEAAQAGPYAPKHAPLTAGDLEGNAGAAAPAKKPTKRVNLADVKSFRTSYVTPRAKKAPRMSLRARKRVGVGHVTGHRVNRVRSVQLLRYPHCYTWLQSKSGRGLEIAAPSDTEIDAPRLA